MKNVLVALAILFMLIGASAKAYAQQAAVFMDSKADDTVGVRLVYALREQLRASHGLRLMDTDGESAIQIHVVTIDPDNTGVRTVYSAVITAKQLNGSGAELYVNNFVGDCGAYAVPTCANTLAAEIDNAATQIRALLMQYLQDHK